MMSSLVNRIRVLASHAEMVVHASVITGSAVFSDVLVVWVMKENTARITVCLKLTFTEHILNASFIYWI